MVALDPSAAAGIAAADRQRTLRALEVCLVAGRAMTELWREHPRAKPRYRYQILGLSPAREDLHDRIAERVKRMFAAGLLDEVRRLLAGGLSPNAHAMKAIGYRESCRVLAGELTETEAMAATMVATRRLAKRQMTWLRGEAAVHWLAPDPCGALAQAIAAVEARCGTGTGAI